ncbi:hypothetical protein P8629_02820 [Hydrogenovibrio sp. 3SP14C1]|uniref:hypothetical protein n=1 Tax=Hydrogenovibrio sp. 3SP14C1 TaxID=3038774 RepID=UPI002417EC92|nr:hypothetical protein [Hydrogenovibrio sp. 3SP14C1]MDG4811930.1 hypothetical protein [Hydrogenovibrio sp. 3SP14C1]
MQPKKRYPVVKCLNDDMKGIGMTEHDKPSSEIVADYMVYFGTTFRMIFFWICSLMIALIGLVMLAGDNWFRATIIFISALIINPEVIKPYYRGMIKKRKEPLTAGKLFAISFSMTVLAISV